MNLKEINIFFNVIYIEQEYLLFKKYIELIEKYNGGNKWREQGPAQHVHFSTHVLILGQHGMGTLISQPIF